MLLYTLHIQGCQKTWNPGKTSNFGNFKENLEF